MRTSEHWSLSLASIKPCKLRTPPPSLSEKSKDWKILSGLYKRCKIQDFHLSTWIFLPSTNPVTCFPWSREDVFHISGVSACPCLKSPFSLSAVLSSRMVFHGVGAGGHSAPALEQPLCLQTQERSLTCPSCFITQTMRTKSEQLIALMTCTASSSREDLNETGILINLFHMKNTRTARQWVFPLPSFPLGCGSLLSGVISASGSTLHHQLWGWKPEFSNALSTLLSCRHWHQELDLVRGFCADIGSQTQAQSQMNHTGK